MSKPLSAGIFWLVLTGLMLPGAVYAQYGVDDYGYPVEDPLAATVVGTPEHLMYHTSDRRPRFRLMKLQTKPEEQIPRYFWYHSEFKYLLFFQRKPAPLIFILAGTGGNFSSPSMHALMHLF